MPGDEPIYTMEEKRDAAKRELSHRKYVYPRLVAAGKMTQALSDRQIRIMAQIVEDYEKAAATGRLL
jgi:hypothetical protein